MANIIVERKSSDFEREMWEFEARDHICLKVYARQTRQTKRHKWRGDTWYWMDERHYNSKLDRPTSIPDDVIQDALEQYAMMPRRVYIGWTAEKFCIGQATPNRKREGK